MNMKLNLYKTDIYPYDLWAAKNTDIQQLMDKFTFLYGDDTVIPDEEVKQMLSNANSLASTYKIVDKVNNNVGSLVIIYQETDVDSIAHESFHVAQDFAEFLGFDFVVKGTNEHFAYLIGWIASKINEFINSNEDTNETNKTDSRDN